MFDKLIESRDSGARRRFARSGAVAFGAHVALVAAAVWGAVRPHAAASAAPLPVLIPWPPGADHSTGTASSRAGGAPRAPVIDVPEDVSVGLPPIDGGLPFDFSAWVSERRGMVRPAQDTGVGGLWSLALPEDPPVVIAGRAPEYPEFGRDRRQLESGVRHPGARLRAPRPVPPGARARAGGAGAGAPADRLRGGDRPIGTCLAARVEGAARSPEGC